MALVIAALLIGIADLFMVRQADTRYREAVARRLDAVCR